MKIKVNGSEITIEKEISVSELLSAQKVDMPDYVTVQINDDIVPNDEFETKRVKEGDAVEFLYFMGGGTL